MTVLRPCIELATNNIVICNLENVDLSLYEPIIQEEEGNRGMIDRDTGVIIGNATAASNEAARLLALQEASIIEEAVSKNPTKRGRPSNK